MSALGTECRKTGCGTFATVVVSVSAAEEANGFWVCTRHVNWALGWMARKSNDWTAVVKLTAWDARRK